MTHDATGERTHALEAEGLVKTFPDGTQALRSVSVRVGTGDFVAIVGRSGSGKSTLMLCMAGILRPDAGRLSYGSQNLLSISDSERASMRRKEFGFVFKLGFLVNELTALENVALPLRLAGATKRSAERTAAETLAEMRIGELADRLPAEMSVGQAQRVAIVRAVVGQPAVVFADEPTGSLDSANGALAMDLLTSSTKARGASLVLVTHDLGLASAADRVVEMQDGQIL